MRKLFLAMALMCAALGASAQVWRTALVKDKFGKKTSDVVFFQTAKGSIKICGKCSDAPISFGFYPHGNSFIRNTAAVFVPAKKATARFAALPSKSAKISLRDIFGKVSAFVGREYFYADGVKIFINGDTRLAELLSKPQTFVATIETADWSGIFCLSGGLCGEQKSE